LVKHGLIEKTLSIPDAYEVFLKVGADAEVQKLRRKVAHGNKMKQCAYRKPRLAHYGSPQGPCNMLHSHIASC